MSLFKPSSETGKTVYDKILIWGPTHTSKTHAALGWPEPALVDVENRGAHFADRFVFSHAQPRTMDEILAIIEELKAGHLPCKSFILDGYSGIYEKLVVRHTVTVTVDGRVSAATDYVTVNKRIAPVREFMFSTSGQNLIITAHAQQKYDRQGKIFTKRSELQFLGDEKFRYAFDYIFRTEATGPDPRVHAIRFHVEKSASPKLKIGEVLLVRPNESLYETFHARVSYVSGSGKAAPAVSVAPPAAVPADPISAEQMDAIEVLSRRAGLGQLELGDFVKRITRRTPLYKNMDASEAQRLITVLEHRSKGAA